MKGFFKSAFIMSFGTLLSRVAGYIRDIFIAKYLGSGFFSDIFFLAFRIPNFFRKIFAEGAFNSAFTPIFASGVQVHGKEKMMIFARNLYSILLYSLLVFTLIVEILMPYLMYILAPGYLNDELKFNLLVVLTRITFPYLIFISLVSLMSGILNTFNKFFAVSVAPVILNFSIIAGIYIFKDYSNLVLIKAMSYSIFVAGILQLIWILIFTLKEKAFLYPVYPRLSKTTKQFFSKFGNSFLASGIVQINSIIDSIIATLVPSAVSILYYGDRVSQFPLSLIGTAIGISILPILAKTLSKKGNKEEAQKIQEDAIFLSCFLGIPSATGLFILSQSIIEILFQRGEFSYENTIQVSTILKFYAIALPFFILSKIFQTIFYAKKDTKTPMKNALYCLILNSCIAISLVFKFGANGIAIATMSSSIFATSILFYKLLKEKIFNFSELLQVKLLKIIYVSIIMGITLICIKIFLEKYEISLILNLLISIGLSGIVFFLMSYVLGILNLKVFLKLLKK
ncbi:MAG TPA: murein biosynthesis integral membrane protein MurJ [Rickettsiales bacterium]|nr:murein biosynthesis integral membrane protein MurJ [Rickettsiales bacterium]